MKLEYSEELTNQFLNKYKELEALANSDYRKWSFVTKKYRKEYEMLRHMRNELSHSEVNNRYPFVVSNEVLDLIQKMLDEVKDRAYTFAKKAPKIINVQSTNNMGEVINLMNKYSYTYLPVLDQKGVVKGIISSDSIIHIINHRRDYNFSFEDEVSKYMKLFSIEENDKHYYIFIPKDIFVYELKEQVEKYQINKARLGIILITENGLDTEKLQGILTPWDLIKLNNIN